eukprot:GFUD01019085.1.p1 GENE.GFUD01019085.1~~GFUD01019085.1.p1  ORF type:complete len:327 (+),score=69.73 GFUD01019085.1:84-1064(+)
MSFTQKSYSVKLREVPQIAPPSNKRGFRSVLAGGLTGGINMCFVFPMEFIKTQLQLDSGKMMFSAHHTALTPYRATFLASELVRVYTGSVDVVKKTVKARGIRGMYRGVTVLLSGTVPMYAVRFGTFDNLKTQFAGPNGQLSAAGTLGCGLGAGVVEAVLVVTWVETLKVRLISDQRKKVPQYRGLIHAASSILRQEGFFGLYKGLAPTILKQGSNQAIRFSAMGVLRGWYTGGDQTKSVPKPFVALFGALAGGASVLGNTPIDVVKTRMQNGSYTSTLECARQVVTKEGVRGFYKGCLPRMNAVCFEVALMFCIYDSIMDVFNKF